MSAIDLYLAKAKKALESGDANLVDRTAKEIVSAFHSEIPHLSHYRGQQISWSDDCFESSHHTSENLRHLIGKLKVLRDQKDNELYASYGLSSLTESIRRLEDALIEQPSQEELADLYKHTDYLYANRRGYESYADGLSAYSVVDDTPNDSQTKLRMEKLRLFRDEQLKVFKLAENGTTNISLSNTNNNHVSIELSSVVKNINDLPDSSLSDDEKDELKLMIMDLHEKDEEKRPGKLKKLLNWLADKGADALTATMPYVIQTIQS